MQDFAAIDFETANGRYSSVCSVGREIKLEFDYKDIKEKDVSEMVAHLLYWSTLSATTASLNAMLVGRKTLNVWFLRTA